MSAKHVLVLGGASVTQGQRCLSQARDRGLVPVLADRRDNLEAVPDVVALAGEVVELDYEDVDACRAWARTAPIARRLLGVCAFREYAALSAAAVAADLGLPGNPVEAVATVRDKARCREALRRLGFPQPRVAPCDSEEGARAFARAGPGPWVVKPASAMGSLGVTRAEDEGEVAAAFSALRAAGHARVLVEDWQDGQEFSAEGYFDDGTPRVVAVTRKHLVPGSFVELGHALPVPPARLRAPVYAAVHAALRGLGLRFGFFHVEFWLHAGDVVLGEVHVRPGGDFLHWLVELVGGVQPYGALFDQMLGQPVARCAPRVPAAAVCFVVPEPGTVTAVGDTADVAGDEACLRLDVTVEPGSVLTTLRDSFDRSGFVAASGGDEQEAWATARELAWRVRDRILLAHGLPA